MPAKVTITLITTTEKEVTIPDQCPSCGADLRESGSIREEGYVAFMSYCHVERDAVQAEDENDQAWEDSPRTLYTCLGCGHVLAGQL